MKHSFALLAICLVVAPTTSRAADNFGLKKFHGKMKVFQGAAGGLVGGSIGCFLGRVAGLGVKVVFDPKSKSKVHMQAGCVLMGAFGTVAGALISADAVEAHEVPRQEQIQAINSDLQAADSDSGAVSQLTEE